MAHATEPAVLDYCVFTHQSDEAGHRTMLAHLGARPLLSLGLRLGEGTGLRTGLPACRSRRGYAQQDGFVFQRRREQQIVNPYFLVVDGRTDSFVVK